MKTKMNDNILQLQKVCSCLFTVVSPAIAEDVRRVVDSVIMDYREVDDENTKLRDALKPFSHKDLSEMHSGNAMGDDSIVFQRNKAVLTIGDFKQAKELLKEGSES